MTILSNTTHLEFQDCGSDGRQLFAAELAYY
jgi:hypothetical protein